jgi:hypothetical protein
MPNRRRLTGVTLAALVVLALSACGTASNQSGSQAIPPGTVATGAAQVTTVPPRAAGATSSASASPGPKLCPNQAAPFDTASFPQTPRVDNTLLPLVPGTRLLLEGRADRGGGVLPHRELFVVTDLVKVIDGVPNVVVFDTDIQDGEIAEAELAFFAQDGAGNVWNLGEYPEEYEAGKFKAAPNVWFSGIGDATAGIQMKAHPHTGAGWYLQGWVPSLDFLDCGRVSKTDTKVCVPVRCFTGVLVTQETSPLDPTNGIQVKYNAPGVGMIQVGAVGGKEGETMQLVENRKLTTKELATARASALALEKHAYQSNPIYKQTKPST